MSHTNQTANYHLPQFIGTDKPAWLVDVNQAYADIDTQMKANETASATAEADAQSALSGVTALNSQVSGIQTSVTALETQAPLDEAQIETNRQNIATNAQNIVEIDNRLGHTSIAGVGDGTVTGAIADLDARPSVSSANDVTYNNADSGLTATNVQDAIDEVNDKISADEIVSVDYTTSQTWTQILTALFSEIDVSKINAKSAIDLGAGFSNVCLQCSSNAVGDHKFSCVVTTGSNLGATQISLDDKILFSATVGGTYNRTDISANNPTANGTIMLRY